MCKARTLHKASRRIIRQYVRLHRRAAMSLLLFHFSAEELKGAQGGVITAVPGRDELATDSYLWGDSKTHSSNDGDCWKPGEKSVVSTYASTWACFCWPCVAPCAELCCSPIKTFDHNWFYRQRLKRAQWIYLCKRLAFLVHALMAWLFRHRVWQHHVGHTTTPTARPRAWKCPCTGAPTHPTPLTPPPHRRAVDSLRANWTSRNADGYTLIPVR